MDMIKDIYNRELYQPFVEYCATHGYHTMRDLGCYDFRLLGRRERVMILVPGNSVESVCITEVPEGGAVC